LLINDSTEAKSRAIVRRTGILAFYPADSILIGLGLGKS
jgi:hypothetical protein